MSFSIFLGCIAFVGFVHSSCVNNQMVAHLNALVDELNTNAANTVHGDKATLFDDMGHIGQVQDQIRHYAAASLLLGNTSATTICEVGFNAGHSASVFLAANPHTRYIAFDLGTLGWSKAQRALIEAKFGGRTDFVLGSSFVTVPQFHAQRSDVQCHLWSIDGDHSANSMKDFVAAREMAAPGGLVLADDYTSSFPAVIESWRQMVDSGRLETIMCHEDPKLYTYHRLKKGWCLGRWLPHSRTETVHSLAHRFHEVLSCNGTHHGVIFSSLFTRTPDNQRGHFVTELDTYVQAFLLSINRLKLHAVIVHDALPDEFMRRHGNERVRFHRVSRALFDVTADRYVHFRTLLHTWPPELGLKPQRVVSADLDVFFQHDPFAFMAATPNAEVFLSVDTGTQDSNGWMTSNMQNCGQQVVHGRAIDNAGYWGAHLPQALKLLDCMHRRLGGLYWGVACDMAVLNACVQELESGMAVHRGGKWSNPFRAECDNPSYVGIHNKCNPPRACLAAKDGNLVREPCVRP